MTPQQQFALTITRATRTGRASIRDSDLSRLAQHWPDLRDVFEELQHLRDEQQRAFDVSESGFD
jgi:hypothetical protein